MQKAKAAGLFFLLAFLFLFRSWGAGRTHYPGDILAAYPLYYDGVSQVRNYDLIDVINIFYPQALYLHERLGQGGIPLWDPYSFCGHSLISNGHSGYFYPPRLLGHLLLPMPWCHDLFLFLHLGLAGFSFFLLLEGLGLKPMSATFGGLVYQFNGFGAGWLEHEHVIAYYAWLPLILYSYHQGFALRRREWWLLAALFLGLLGTVGMVQFWAYSLILCACWGLWLWWGERRLPTLLTLVLSWGGALAVAAVAILPIVTDLEGQSRPVIPWDYQVKSLQQLLLTLPLGLVLPDFAGNPVGGFHLQRVSLGGNWIYPESCVYLGLVPLLFLPFAWLRRERRECSFFALFLLATLLLCATPLFAVVHTTLPGFDKTIITRVLFFLPLCLGVLSAHGFEACQPEHLKRAGALAGLLLLILLVVYGWFAGAGQGLLEGWLQQGRIRLPDPQITADFPQAARLAFSSFYALDNFSFWWPLTVLLVAVVLLFYSVGDRRGLLVLLVLASLDPMLYALRFNSAVSPEKLYRDTPETAFLREKNRQEYGRIMSLAAIRPNTLLALGLPGFEGDESLYPRATQAYASALANRHPSDWTFRFGVKTFPINQFEQRLVNLAAVDWLVTYPGVELGPPWELAQSAQLQVFHNPQAFPDVYWVPRARGVADNSEALRALFSEEWRPDEVVLEGPSGGQTEGQPLALEYRRPRAEQLAVPEYPGPGYVVWVEGFHRGWKAFEGGAERPLYRANGMFMAVPVSGSGPLQLRFDPPGWPHGLYISLATVVLLSMSALGLVLFGRPDDEEGQDAD